MIEIIISALLLGFSTGLSCLATCAPFYLPYLMAEERRLKVNFLEFTKFLFGRLAGYLLFGLLVGFLGQKLNLVWLNFLSLVSLAALSLFIILYSLNFFKIKNYPLVCRLSSIKIKPPFLIGLLTGVNLCPPFLLSLNYVFILGKVWFGLVFFFFFFLATNLYFMPLIFLGKFSRLSEFKILARITMLAVGTIFFIYSLYQLIFEQSFLHL